MDIFNALFNKHADIALKDKIAELLKTDRSLLEKFEKSYRENVLASNSISDNLFEVNSRQMASLMPTMDTSNSSDLTNLINRIVEELMGTTEVLSITEGVKIDKFLPTQSDIVSNEEINKLPENIRPQLTGSLMKVDISEQSYISLFDNYIHFLEEKDKNKKQTYYHLFRQGLDILDLDPITYAMLGQNRNSMGYWLPPLKMAVDKTAFFKIPKTKIVKVPMPILQLTRLDYMSLTPTTLKIVNDWAFKAFDLDISKSYFVKTGTYSSKFDFRNCKVVGEKEVRELGEYLLFIHYQANCMAHPTNTPCIYGVSTTNEWVVREFIEDVENNPTIYMGLPLHTEYRIFVDFDNDSIIGYSPYWEPNTMLKRFSQENDASSPHKRHDYIIYKSYEGTLMKRFHENIEKVIEELKKVIPNVSLKGQWSIDIMQNGSDFWIIDMATADTSALNFCVPRELLKKSEENWIPQIENS